jgi:hypothetical protein
MINGKLPEELTEQRLIEIGATVLSVKSLEEFPFIITESMKQRFLQKGISEEMLEKAGAVVVDDEVISRGKAEIIVIIKEQSRKALSRVKPLAPAFSVTNMHTPQSFSNNLYQ